MPGITSIAPNTQDATSQNQSSLSVSNFSLPNEFVENPDRIKLKVVLSGISDGIIVVDKDRKVSMMNKAAEKILEVGSIDAKDQQIDNIINVFKNEQKFPTDKICPATDLIQDGVIFDDQELDLKIGQITKIVHITSHKVKEAKDIDIGCILTIRDVTKQKDFEHMKLDFVSLAAHELRTPATSMKGFLGYLVRPEVIEKLTETEADFVNKSKAMSEKISEMIEDILFVAKIDEGNVRLNKTVTQLEDLAKIVHERNIARATDAEITLSYIPPIGKIPKVNIDIEKIRIAAEKVMDNALRYTPQKGRVEIRVFESEDHKPVLAILDNGKGIPQEKMDYLFTKFFRVKEKDLIMENVGIGLGLYVVKQILDKHDADILLKSKEGEGTQVYMVFKPAES